MATVKVKYRASIKEGKDGRIYFQVIHNRVIRQLNTEYRLSKEEWENSALNSPNSIKSRESSFSTINDMVLRDLEQLNMIISILERSGNSFTADNVIEMFKKSTNSQSFFRFIEDTIISLKSIGKFRISETYTSALNSFKRFRMNQGKFKDIDLSLDEINSEMMTAYEIYLKEQNISRNSSSFYMRNLRALYNRAVDKNLLYNDFRSDMFIPV